MTSKKFILFILSVAAIFGASNSLYAATIIYSNNFESPSGIISGPTYADLSQQTVNALYGSEFNQTNTVETILINGSQNIYTDSSGTGGNYSIGMLSTVQDDKLALAIDTQGYGYVNVAIDLSGIALQGNSGGTYQFLTGNPTLAFSLFDTTANTPIFNGTLLDNKLITGVGDTNNPFTFNWTHFEFGLDTSSAATSWVSLVFDLTNGGYASFDNLVVAVSDTQGDVGGPNPVPEPSTILLLGGGLLGLGWYGRKRKKA